MATTKFDKPVGTEISQINSKIVNLVLTIPTFSLGELSTGSHGYVIKNVTLPTGFVAKMAVVEIGRIGNINGNLIASCTTDADGTVYVSYYSFADFTADNSKVQVKVLCVPSV